MAKPELVVFDLDFTLWHCGGTYCDCSSAPFRKDGPRILDRMDGEIEVFPDAWEILDACEAAGLEMGLASRTMQPEWARELLDLLEIRNRFAYQEIYPSTKIRHFETIKAQSGLAYERMVFFDDEMRNIEEVSELGVESIYVSKGLRWSDVPDSLAHIRPDSA